MFVLDFVVEWDQQIVIEMKKIMTKCIQVFGMHNYHPKNLRKSLNLVKKV